jgi:4-hydroxybenzoate polyprenyltransferase
MSLKAMVRFDNWWYSKIPPLLAVAYLEILLGAVSAEQGLLLLVSLVFSIACIAAYGHVVNDVFDVEADRRAGKPNAMAGWSRGRQVAIVALFAVAGFAPSLVVDYSWSGRLLLFINYMMPTFYSLPGVRLKERGGLGVLCDAGGSHIIPTCLVLTVFSHQPGAVAADPGFLAVLVLWSCVMGIKGILYHQVADRENDRAAGVATLLTWGCPERVAHFLSRYNLCIEFPAAALVVMVVFELCPLASVAFFAYCAIELVKYLLGCQFKLNANPRNTRATFPFVNNSFYDVWFPACAVVQLALEGPGWVWLALVHLGVFFRVILDQISDLRSVAGALRGRWRKGCAEPSRSRENRRRRRCPVGNEQVPDHSMR